MLYIKDYLIIFLTVCGLWSLSHAENEDHLNNRKLHIRGFHSSKTTKRALLSFGIKNFIKGEQATKKLLKGTIQLQTPTIRRENYLKQGDYKKAVHDFYSVKPSNVQDIVMPDRVKGKIGTVGDRTIKVQTWVDHGVTSIIITKGLGTSKERVKYIAYLKEQLVWPFGQKCTTCSN